ncbi:sulfite exporter TauE/SafE family protein [Clostridium oceanicum]|uniref:Probable membrane transporter protein n=1 Tax=Clostridium oceanicum TaxID=1543 RepID=A0ABP3UKH1_9CLOT
MIVKVVFGVLLILTIYFAITFFKDYAKVSKEGNLEKDNFWIAGGVGFVANFFDTLGIGSFAPLTAMLKFFHLVEDRVLPGTLNVSCTLPVVTEALIFITVIEVDPITLFSMLISSTVGAVVGASVVSKFDEKKVQLAMGLALLVVAVLMLASQLKLMPMGGDAIGLTGGKLVIAVVVNFFLGALMTLGIGLYAPCMALIYALGMSPKVAYPIMMGSCAYLMPASASKFVKESAYNRKVSMSITIFGVIGVLIAAYLVKSLPIKVLTWIVIVVIVYTSITMLKAYSKNKAKESQSLSN